MAHLEGPVYDRRIKAIRTAVAIPTFLALDMLRRGPSVIKFGFFESLESAAAGAEPIDEVTFTAGQDGYPDIVQIEIDLNNIGGHYAGVSNYLIQKAMATARGQQLRLVADPGDPEPESPPPTPPPAPAAGTLVPADDSQAATRSFNWEFAPLPSLSPGASPIVTRRVHFIVSSIDIGLLDVPLSEGDSRAVPGQLGAGDHAVVTETLINAAGLEGEPTVSEFDVPGPG